MTSIDSLKKDFALLNKALSVKDKSYQREQIEKLLFYVEKLVEFSRYPNLVEQAEIDREIDDFNAKYLLPGDVLRR